MYSDTAALESHVKDHEISAQSLAGEPLKLNMQVNIVTVIFSSEIMTIR